MFKRSIERNFRQVVRKELKYMDNKEKSKNIEKIKDKEEILDCTKEIEEYIKNVLPEESDN